MRKYYTIEYKLRVLGALDMNNGSIYVTAKQFGLPRQTVNDWSRDRARLFEQSQAIGEGRRLPMTRRLTLLINQIVDSLPSKVEQAKLADAARTLSILIDVNRMLTAEEEASEVGDMEIYEKLAVLIKRYAPDHAEDMDDEGMRLLPEGAEE